MFNILFCIGAETRRLKEQNQQFQQQVQKLKKDNQQINKLNQQINELNQQINKLNKELNKWNEKLKDDNKWLRNQMITMKQNDENDEINRLFNNNIKKETISNEDIEIFIEEFDEFDKMFDEYFYEREQRLRKPIQKMNDEFEETMIRWKKNKQNRRMTELDEIQQKYDGFIEGTEEMIKQKQRAQNRMLGEYGTSIEMVRKLKEYGNVVEVSDMDGLDENRKQIQVYEQFGLKYQIMIDFQGDDSSVDEKMKMMNMVDELKVNYKVGKVYVRASNDNKLIQEVVQMMVDRYHNVYEIGVNDSNDQVDEEMHDEIQQLVRQSALVKFRLEFGSLGQNEDKFRLTKKYNRLVQHQYYLEELGYNYDKIDKEARSQQAIDEMIDEVDRMQ